MVAIPDNFLPNTPEMRLIALYGVDSYGARDEKGLTVQPIHMIFPNWIITIPMVLPLILKRMLLEVQMESIFAQINFLFTINSILVPALKGKKILIYWQD